jgi:hypothetical protein
MLDEVAVGVPVLIATWQGAVAASLTIIVFLLRALDVAKLTGPNEIVCVVPTPIA